MSVYPFIEAEQAEQDGNVAKACKQGLLQREWQVIDL